MAGRGVDWFKIGDTGEDEPLRVIGVVLGSNKSVTSGTDGRIDISCSEEIIYTITEMSLQFFR